MPIAANLRHDKLDAFVTEDSLTGAAPADYPFATELAFTFRLARHLKALREIARGKPENFNRPDYNFRLETADGTLAHAASPRATRRSPSASAAAARRSTSSCPRR